jgi:septum formation protein
MPLPAREIYLASRSPRRRDLLALAGVPFRLLVAGDPASRRDDVDEFPLPGEPPREYVLRLARAKAAAGWQLLVEQKLPRAPVLAADTTVALGGRILGKPADRAEAAEMLAALADRDHEVLTGVAVRLEAQLETALSVSQVRFGPLSAEDIRGYVASGECDDKAGAYAIQGRAARFVREVHGSPSGIVGLPLYETVELLARLERARE